ncbi:MAG: DUF4292 domain-containing protein [Bacteroidaceae bacterium]|nr:DUF4292 domain-containing protein [Bacteroidaceae bacterium]
MDKIALPIPLTIVKKHLLLLVLPFVLCLLLAGCGAVNQVTTSPEANQAPRMRIASPLTAIATPLANHTDLSLRMAVEATYGEKTLPVKGNLRMRRDEVIQMAFTALGMIEVARVEMTPEAVWIIDRLNKQYAKAKYSELPFLGQSLVNYSLIESLLWNELFLPGQKNVTAHLDKFNVEPSGTQRLIQPKDQKALSARFWTDAEITRLQRTRLQFGTFLSDWTYSGYQLVGDTRYPSALSATLEGDGKKASVQVSFTNITLDSKDWTPRTNLTNYTQLSAAELLSKLSFLK